MKQIDIICNDKLYTEMLCLELADRGYKTSDKSTGRADVILIEADYRGNENTVTFSKKAGADLLRPFDIEELVSLIEEKSGSERSVSEEEFYVSAASPYAVYRGERIDLSELEHRLLCYLYGNRDRYIPISELARELFGDEASENPVRVYVSYLRNKLDEAFGVKLIYTARGKGYMFKVR